MPAPRNGTSSSSQGGVTIVTQTRPIRTKLAQRSQSGLASSNNNSFHRLRQDSSTGSLCSGFPLLTPPQDGYARPSASS
jgi:hypothetical protein